MGQVDKLDGEFRVPLDMGTGSEKSRVVDCPNCGDVKFTRIKCYGIICYKCNTYFNPKDRPEMKDFSNYDVGLNVHVRDSKTVRYLAFRKEHEIRGQMYNERKTRKTMGSIPYRKEFNKRMKAGGLL